MSDLFLRTCAGEVTKTRPVWIMRQAGRYLPEYRKIRAAHPNFIEFYKNPQAACEVTLQPIDRFDLDAAILFSDILTLLPPLGFDLEFIPGRGPVVHNPYRTMQDAEKINAVDAEKDLHFVYDAIRLIRKKLDGRVPLLGFAGGPLTVASYIIEGGSSKELGETKKLCFNNPEAFQILLTKITELTINYLSLQAEAGAQTLVVMDSWAGHFSPADYQQYVFPYTQQIFKALRAKTKVPLLHYANGASALLPQFAEFSCDALGVDWRIDIAEAIKKAPQKILQGNLDPCTLYSTPEDITRKTHEILEKVQGRPHIMNLGHGILPSVPIAGVEAFLKAIRG
jgi:uroporphyrinogen decarboxylase